MNNYHHSRRCTFCNEANAPARIMEYDTGTETVTEAKYICPRCNNLIARDIIGRKAKK